MSAAHVHHSRSFLTIDKGLKLLLRVSTQLHLHKRAGDAAAGLGEVSGSDNLQNTLRISNGAPGTPRRHLSQCVP